MHTSSRRAGISVLLTSGALLLGCSSYSEVGPLAYEYSKALYSICNRQDKPRLGKVSEQIKTARATAQLPSNEADWLDAIIATAEAGDWQEATRSARRLMEAQVEKH